MKRVTGIGGVFFKSKDPKALGAWYKTHLGINVEEWGGAAFRWKGPDNPEGGGTTIWNPFAADTGYFTPSTAPFMINYRVGTCMRSWRHFGPKGFKSKTRSTSPRVASSAGPTTQMETSLSFGNRQQVNERQGQPPARSAA